MDILLQKIDINTYIGDISKRKDLSWDIIQKYSALPWPTSALSRLAPLDYIIDHPEQTWDFDIISSRKDLTIEFIKHFKNQLNQSEIAYNINLKDVIENPDLPWNYDALSWNTQISSNDLIEYPDLPWNYANLTNHIDPDFIYANPNLPWDEDVLSEIVSLDFILQNSEVIGVNRLSERNPNLNIDYVLEHLDDIYNWIDVYQNPNITLDDIIQNKLHMENKYAFQYTYPEYCIENGLEINWLDLTQTALLDIIEKYPDQPWSKNHLSQNTNMTMDYVLAHPDIKWYYEQLSCDNQITLSDVLDNWDLPWDILSIIRYKY